MFGKRLEILQLSNTWLEYSKFLIWSCFDCTDSRPGRPQTGPLELPVSEASGGQPKANQRNQILRQSVGTFRSPTHTGSVQSQPKGLADLGCIRPRHSNPCGTLGWVSIHVNRESNSFLLHWETLAVQSTTCLRGVCFRPQLRGLACRSGFMQRGRDICIENQSCTIYGQSPLCAAFLSVYSVEACVFQ